MNWLPEHIELAGEKVILRTLEGSDFEELLILSAEKSIWTHYAIDGADNSRMQLALEEALVAKESGHEFPFVIESRTDKKLIGSTRFLDVQAVHRKLEIGWTWMHPDYWGTGLNIECKLLLLSYCFEQLNTSRVQLKTDELNIRSRKAILKIGARFEGILRNDMLRENNTLRNSAYYSIIQSEWPETKVHLQQSIN